MRLQALCLLPLFTLLASCAGTMSPSRAATPADLAELADWLSGSFSSATQAAHDASFFDVRLHIVPIWSAREDGPWLYVEQALGSQLDKPYRQRVYRLRALADGRFESAVYTLPDPTAAVGAWRTPGAFPLVAPDALELRTGCAVLLQRSADGTRFEGGTAGKDCASDLRGASYATSEVVLDAQRISSWDRGYDAGGAQVWGASDGPYVFERQVSAD